MVLLIDMGRYYWRGEEGASKGLCSFMGDAAPVKLWEHEMF